MRMHSTGEQLRQEGSSCVEALVAGILSLIALIAATMCGWSSIKMLEIAKNETSAAHRALLLRTAFASMARSIAPSHLDPQPEIRIAGPSLELRWTERGSGKRAHATLSGTRLRIEGPGTVKDFEGIETLEFKELRGFGNRIIGFSALVGFDVKPSPKLAPNSRLYRLSFAFTSISPSKGEP